MNEMDVKRASFFTAATIGDIDLLEKHVIPIELLDKVDDMGRNVFHSVCLKGHLHVLKYLKEKYKGGAGLLWARDKRGMTALHLSAASGNLEVVQWLLLPDGGNISPRISDNVGNTALHYAMESGKTSVCKWLIRAGSDPFTFNNNRQTPFDLVPSRSVGDAVRALIEPPPPPSTPIIMKYSSTTAMVKWFPSEIVKEGTPKTTHYEVQYGHKFFGGWESWPNKIPSDGSSSSLLLTIGTLLPDKTYIVRVCAFNSNGQGPWSLTSNEFRTLKGEVNEGNEMQEITKPAVKISPTVSSYDNGDSFTIPTTMQPSSSSKLLNTFFNAAISNDVTTLDVCFQEDSEILQAYDDKGMNALHKSVSNGATQATNWLIEKGVVLDSLTCNGGTALHLAAFKGYFELLKRLVECGLSVTSTDSMNIQPLMLASDRGFLLIVEWLIRAVELSGGLINGTDKNGYSALHWGARRGQLNVCSLLIKKGLSPTALTAHGETSLHLAATSTSIETISLLMKSGCNAKQQDKEGLTPYERAVKAKKSESVIEFLRIVSSAPSPPSISISSSTSVSITVKCAITNTSSSSSSSILLSASTSSPSSFLATAASFSSLTGISSPSSNTSSPSILNTPKSSSMNSSSSSLSLSSFQEYIPRIEEIEIQWSSGGFFDKWKGVVLPIKYIGKVYQSVSYTVSDLKSSGKHNFRARCRSVNGWGPFCSKVEGVAVFSLASTSSLPTINPVKDSELLPLTIRKAAMNKIHELRGVASLSIVQSGANENNSSISPLIAAANGDIKLLESLDLNTSMFTTKDECGRGVCYYAALMNEMDTLRYLCIKGDRDVLRGDILWGSLVGGHVRIADWAMEGLPISNESITKILTEGKNTMSLMQLASLSGQGASVKWLMDKGIHPDCIFYNQESLTPTLSTPIALAAFSGCVDICEILFSNGGKVDFEDEDSGWTIYHYASLSPNSKSLEWLTKRHVQIDPSTVDFHGRSLAHIAAFGGCVNSLSFLFENGIKVNVKDSAGNTLLHAAAAGVNVSTFKWLLNMDVIDIDEKNNNGETCADIARKEEGNEITLFLKTLKSCPCPPLQPSLQSCTLSTLSLSLKMPSLFFGSCIPTLYEVAISPRVGCSWKSVGVFSFNNLYNDTSLTITLKSLDAKTFYKVRCRCRNENGWSDWSCSALCFTDNNNNHNNNNKSDEELFLWLQAHGLDEIKLYQTLKSLGVKTSLDLIYVDPEDIKEVVTVITSRIFFAAVQKLKTDIEVSRTATPPLLNIIEGGSIVSLGCGSTIEL